ncbi:hypothetical protein SAMN04488004_13025 [Loktanella salsilacus]|uniref:Uncharacterized protein n=1 Tax=Loktanella salsilacus TaxID=195913 RepID=A0A1I4IXA5_9RHOB|nr:hypothetical protein [Loktanella salsilacus]SFL58910.1 hypothetical protein SAMN04488004_13025 [Loktanella salsilacus]
MQFLKTEHGIITCERVIEGIAINPVDPPGVCDPIRRSAAEITLWRGRPYVVGRDGAWVVRCLQFPTDRPTVWGTFLMLEEAVREATSDPRRPEGSTSTADLGDMNI